MIWTLEDPGPSSGDTEFRGQDTKLLTVLRVGMGSDFQVDELAEQVSILEA